MARQSFARRSILGSLGAGPHRPIFPWPKPNAGFPTPQVVSVKVTAPERKELPPIDGQVPRDAGVEGMHPVDFKAFWEQSLFKIFKLLSTCLVVPVGFTCMPWVSTLLVLLCFAMFCYVLLIGSSGFLLFCCHKIVPDCAFFFRRVQAQESAKYDCCRPAR